MSKTTRAIMAVQLQEEEKKSSGRWQQVLWVFYVVLVVYLCGASFARIVCLFRRSSWRSSLDGQFPEACGDWATKGCTRVVLEADGCVRANDIVYANTIVI
jgi:hypothetical protein